MRKFLGATVLFISILLLAACGSNEDTLSKIQDEGVVKIGFANEKPYAYEEDGELKGAAVDIAKAVFKELGVDEVDPHLAEFGDLIAGLDAGRFDVVTAGMAITPDRCENVIFGEPEMKYGEGLVVPKGNPLDLHSYEDIANNPDITVSIMQGATEIGFVQEMGVDEDQIKSAPDIPATFSDVESGRADVTTATEMTLKMALLSADNDDIEFVEDFEQPDVEGNPSYGSAAFKQGEEELVEAYNEALQKLKDDGTVAELLEENYFDPVDNFPEEEVTAEKVCEGEFY
ncbi:MAG TPA: ectoine/hydroxyectoine ABC transporter substrate-binding protein EhuB [Bacillota bacterium]|nr:ectoine/hydroxyectoine ABC transporter substrate-binding protein EhuB [Bacillota bacterium]